jgi:hypothetical protein
MAGASWLEPRIFKVCPRLRILREAIVQLGNFLFKEFDLKSSRSVAGRTPSMTICHLARLSGGGARRDIWCCLVCHCHLKDTFKAACSHHFIIAFL